MRVQRLHDIKRDSCSPHFGVDREGREVKYARSNARMLMHVEEDVVPLGMPQLDD